MTKQQIAVQAIKDLAEHFAQAPLKEEGRGYCVDTLLEKLLDGFNGQPFHIGHPDPTATDSGPTDIDNCVICGYEGHNSECPVGILETLLKIGIASPVLMSFDVGRVRVTVPEQEPMLNLPLDPEES